MTMNTENYMRLAKRMATKLRAAKANYPEKIEAQRSRYYIEFRGMAQALDTLGVEFHYEFDDNYNISAVIVNGERADV